MAIAKKFVGSTIGKAGVKRAVKGANKEAGTKRIVGSKQAGRKSVKDMSPMEKLEFEFDGLKKTAQRAIISNVRQGKPSKYSDMLELKKGIEREGKTAERKARQAQAVKEFNERNKAKKGYGGKMTKKKYGNKVTKKAAGGAAAQAAMAYMEGRKKRRKQAAKDLGPKVLKKGGTPKGVGCATRGYGKAMK